jgi:hypothetical protein
MVLSNLSKELRFITGVNDLLRGSGRISITVHPFLFVHRCTPPLQNIDGAMTRAHVSHTGEDGLGWRLKSASGGQTLLRPLHGTRPVADSPVITYISGGAQSPEQHPDPPQTTSKETEGEVDQEPSRAVLLSPRHQAA